MWRTDVHSNIHQLELNEDLLYIRGCHKFRKRRIRRILHPNFQPFPLICIPYLFNLHHISLYYFIFTHVNQKNLFLWTISSSLFNSSWFFNHIYSSIKWWRNHCVEFYFKLTCSLRISQINLLFGLFSNISFELQSWHNYGLKVSWLEGDKSLKLIVSFMVILEFSLFNFIASRVHVLRGKIPQFILFVLYIETNIN